MKKLSEVCKEVGVTRRTLQWYNKIGLLTPTTKTEHGYWLYDDYAVSKLETIQLLLECDYSLEQIKQLFDGEATQDANEVINEVIDTLEKKQKQIEGMITMLKLSTSLTQLPDSTVKILYNIGRDVTPEEDNFHTIMQRNISDFSEMDEAEIQNGFIASSVLITIGCHKDDPYDSPDVIECFDKLVDSTLQMLFDDKDIPNPEKIRRSDIVDMLYESLNEGLSDDEAKNMIDSQCGEGAIEYILEAAKVYEQQFKKNQKEEG